MVKISPDELSHPQSQAIAAHRGVQLRFRGLRRWAALDFGPAATLAFLILVRTRPMSALAQKQTSAESFDQVCRVPQRNSANPTAMRPAVTAPRTNKKVHLT